MRRRSGGQFKYTGLPGDLQHGQKSAPRIFAREFCGLARMLPAARGLRDAGPQTGGAGVKEPGYPAAPDSWEFYGGGSCFGYRVQVVCRKTPGWRRAKGGSDCRKRASGSPERAPGSGERVSGSGERASGSRERVSGSGERVSGSGERAPGSRERVSGSGERASGSGERASGSGERASGLHKRGSGLHKRGSGNPLRGLPWEFCGLARMLPAARSLRDAGPQAGGAGVKEPQNSTAGGSACQVVNSTEGKIRGFHGGWLKNHCFRGKSRGVPVPAAGFLVS
jgi:hypothetical protein